MRWSCRHRSLSSLVLLIALGVLLSSRGGVPHAEAEGGTFFMPFVAKNDDPTWLWLPPVMAESISPSIRTALTIIDHQGRLHVLYDTSTSPRFIYHMFIDNGAWTTPQPVALSLGISTVQHPPFIDAAGHIHLLWRNGLDGVADRNRLLYARYDGAQWSGEEEVYRSDNYYLQGMVHGDEQGQIYVSLLDSHGSTRAFQARRTQIGWDLSGPITAGHVTNWVWPDGAGGMHFYGTGYPTAVHYSYWDDGGFRISGWQTAGTLSGRDTQLDSRNNLHSFWLATISIPGGSTRALHHQCLRPNLAWSETAVLTGEAYASGTPRKAADNEGRVALAWSVSGTPGTRLGLWDDCAQFAETTLRLPDAGSWYELSMTLSAVPQQLCVLLRQSYPRTYAASCVRINA